RTRLLVETRRVEQAPGRELGVARGSIGRAPRRRPVAGLLDAQTHIGGRLTVVDAQQALGFDTPDVDVHVDAIEERTAQPLAVDLQRARRAPARLLRAAMTARTGIHRGDEHEAGWKRRRMLGARDGDVAVLEGLPERLEDRARKLRELVHE